MNKQMRTSLRLVLSALAVTAGMALTGCGGSDTPPPVVAPPIVVPPVVVPPAVVTSTTFTVRDTAGVAMLGATVYAIPAADVTAIAAQPMPLSQTTGLYSADAQKVDEPLEDLINGNYTPTGGGVATYVKAVVDAAGKAVITDLPTSASYFIYVKPASTDAGHLPGGSLTRAALAGSALVSKDTAVKVSTMPSSAAKYIGSSLCLACHKDKAGIKQTLHKLGIMAPKSPSGLQDLSQFSSTTNVDQDFNAGLKKFEGAGTTLYYYNFTSSNNGFKTLPTNPTATQLGSGQPVYFTLELSKTASGVFQVKFNNLITPTDPLNGIVRKVDLTYGGGLHKQRYMTKIGTSTYVLPLQFQPQGSDSSTESRRFQWIEYDTVSKKWWNPTTKAFIDPNTDATGQKKSFDIFCAACHYTGYSVTKNSDNSFTASAASDYKGEVNPATGKLQEMNIGCESCHGPGSEHMDAGGQGKFILTPQNLTPEREVQICAACHTRTNSNDKDGLKLESPLDKNNQMMLPGTSRADFLKNNVSTYDTTAFWADSKHAKKHHSQATEFVQTKKYRNGTKLTTCASCHDVHAPGTDRHQLSGTSDNKLCLSCHTTKTDLKAHMDATTGYNMGAGTLCIQCHLQKTAQSGSGSPTTAFKSPSGQEYFHNDISSHMFDVPLKSSISANNKMPIAFTNECGICHNPVRLP